MGKRVIAMILALTMLAGVLPAGAMAQQTQASVETDDLVVSGNNSFGTLLSERISEHQAEGEASAEGYLPGYSINSLSVKGSTARVGYDAAGPALLVVALYSEDGLQLLTSASAEVSADATVAELTFAGEMPDYFLASAYLLDTFGFSPLCGTFETPLYTEKLQKLRASTAADYDKDHRCFDPCIWLDPLGRLWFVWAVMEKKDALE